MSDFNWSFSGVHIFQRYFVLGIFFSHAFPVSLRFPEPSISFPLMESTISFLSFHSMYECNTSQEYVPSFMEWIIAPLDSEYRYKVFQRAGIYVVLFQLKPWAQYSFGRNLKSAP